MRHLPKPDFGSRLSAFALAVTLLSANATLAAPVTWQGGGGATGLNWSKNGNWDPDTPTQGDRVTINNGDTVQMDVLDVKIDTLTLGPTTQSGLVVKSGNALTLESGLSALNNGSTLETETTSTLNNADFLNSDGTLNNYGTLSNGSSATLSNNNGTLFNSSAATLSNNGTLFNSSTSGGLHNTGALFNNSSGLLITNGTLANFGEIQNTGTLDNFGLLENFASGSLDNAGTLQNNGTLNNSGTFENSGTVTNNGYILLQQTSTISSGTVTNNSGGLFALDGFSTISGDAEVTNNTGGVMRLWNGSTVTGGSITNKEGGKIERFGSGTSTIAGTLVNQGLVKGNSGSGLNGFGDGLILTGDVSGAGRYEGSITFDGTFRPGNSPALIDAETLTFGASNDLYMELGGLLRGDEYDAFNISGGLTFGGDLFIDLINGFSLGLGNSFDLFDFDPFQTSGTFANIVLPALSNIDWFWDTSALYTTGIIAVATAEEPPSNGVPGPGAVFILVIGMAGFAGLRRRTQ